MESTTQSRNQVEERCCCDDLVDTSVGISVKAATLRVSPSIVTVITHNVPDDMLVEGQQTITYRSPGTYVFPGSGVIITSHVDAADSHRFVTTILCLAVLFRRTNDIPLHEIQVDVRLWDGSVFKAQLLACDFHYNIAAVTIHSDTQLQPANLRNITDVTSLRPHDGERPAKLQRHSDINQFKVQYGSKILLAKRSWTCPYEIKVSTGVFRPTNRKELFAIKGSKMKCSNGGAIINYHGEVIGICLSDATFLPSNLVSRWWDHYRSNKEFLRPWLGVKVANLYEAPTNFLKQFVRKYPKIVTGVAVTKVEENSPAHQVGMQRNDVIVTCDGNRIRNKLEFLEKIWDHAGEVVVLEVLKTNGGKSKLSMAIGETPSDNLYEWKLPVWWLYRDYDA